MSEATLYLDALLIFLRSLLHIQWWQALIWGLIGLILHYYGWARHQSYSLRSERDGWLRLYWRILGWLLAIGCGPLVLWENRATMQRGKHR